MKKSDFNFYLPENLIAQYPVEKRGQSKLMTLDRLSGARAHTEVCQLPDILCGRKFLSAGGEKPLLVFNDTKVRKARLYAINERTGAKLEFLLLDDVNSDGLLWKVMAKRARRKRIGDVYLFPADVQERIKAVISGFEDEYILLKFENPINDAWLEKNGHVPLPPYIRREDVSSDTERYQTIYARQTGSTAAPTAGLHFTKEIFDAFNSRGIESVFITLHVGLGTFLPVRTENIEDHKMHSECFYIDDKTAVKIEEAKKAGRKIIAVGTTSVRTLESAWLPDGKLKRGENKTSIFIYPGYKFKVVDAIFTNFHTPESTLLMLVSAFAGRELILESYEEAISEGYRFFSYGDAMLLH
ncbi:tRNA preQ1(34) S-adenosylmethionine ribosyltransferase-isomerase QueA [Treponema sp. R80B11-R83G3]